MSVEIDKALDTPAEAAALAEVDQTDRGDDFTPTEAEPDFVELSSEEQKALAPKASEAEKGKTEAADPKAEEAKEGEKPRDDKGQFIPRARFNEVNNRAKAKVAALEAKIKGMAERLAPLDGVAPDIKALETALDAKETEYGALLADGKLDEAKLVLREINRVNRQLGAIEAGALASTHAQESTHVDSLGQLVEMYKESFPQFDDANKELYSQDMVNFVADLQGRFEFTGLAPAEALRQAVELTVAKFRLDETEPAEVKPDPKAKLEERKAASVAKAVKASQAQPARLDKVGADSDKAGLDKLDLNSLTYDQFSRLPEATLSRLRGDLV